MLTEAEKIKFMTHDDLIVVLPLVTEADMMAQELGANKSFDVKLTVRLMNGIFKAEVCVEMKCSDTGQCWLWSKEKFLNRT